MNAFSILASPRSAVVPRQVSAADAEPEPEEDKSEQFDVSDTRTLDKIVKWLMELGYFPSLLYRLLSGRTQPETVLCLFVKADRFENCCQPNALMTLKEYLMDYASPETKKIGEKLISEEINHIPNEKVRKIVIDNLKAIEEDNRRDFRF